MNLAERYDTLLTLTEKLRKYEKLERECIRVGSRLSPEQRKQWYLVQLQVDRILEEKNKVNVKELFT